MHVEINANEAPSRAHDISERVEDIVNEEYGVEPTVHMDPIQPDHPTIKDLQDYLQAYSESEDRITNIHDIRVVDTDEHHVILFGINFAADIGQAQMLTCESEIKESVKSSFSGFEVEIKISPMHRY
jgi:divalent metal cation (Fe/Co/Zn/Cd) transporter